MANWLERAKREIPKSAGRVTAITDDRNPTAVTAVTVPDESEITRSSIGSNGSARAAFRMTVNEENLIRAWLAHIEETDPLINADVLNRCRADGVARDYFIQRGNGVPQLMQGVKHAKF